MKKTSQPLMFLICLLVLAFTPSIIFSQIAVEPAGDGTDISPFEISSLENLYWISQNPNTWNDYFVQTNNIDASSTSAWNAGEGWEPIGYYNSWNDYNSFSGSYDGGGHTISGLTINRPASDYQGLFGAADAVSISNLVLEDVSIIGRDYVGGVYGRDQVLAMSYITNVSVSGNVVGRNYVGFVVGRGYYGSISESFSGGTVSGNSYTGGLVGSGSRLEISESFSTADVEGGSYIGGLAGYLSNVSQVITCYSFGNISTLGNYVGGLLGILDNSTIESSYSCGEVSGGSEVGGLVGIVYNSSINYSFWNVDTSNQTVSAGGGEGKTNEEMLNFQTFITAGWDFKGIGEHGIWNMGNGRNNGFPYFDWQYPNDAAPDEEFAPFTNIEFVTDIATQTATVNSNIVFLGNPTDAEYGVCWSTEPNPTIDDYSMVANEVLGSGLFTTFMTGLSNNTTYYVRAYGQNSFGIAYSPQVSMITYDIEPVQPEGIGSEGDPYLIASLANLLWLSQNSEMWDRHYLQTNNIDASSTSVWNEGEGWEPIGYYNSWSDYNYFSGSYNGGGHTISGLTINRPGSNNQGLFGVVDGATVSNLVLENVSIIGKDDVGGLLGRSYDLNVNYIANLSVSGTVSGSYYLGGIVGTGHNLHISKSFSSAVVDGDYYTGGLAGYLTIRSQVINCYSSGNISATNNVGGLVGYLNNSTIENSYSFGEVSGSFSLVGGLVGRVNNSIVNSSFWNTEASNQDESAAGEGKNIVEMQDVFTYLDARWGFKTIGYGAEVWNIGNGRNNGYPYLIWEHPNDPHPDAPERPIIATFGVGNITSTSVIGQGEILFPGIPNATQHGVCWAASENPTIDDAHTTEGEVVERGVFNSEISGLTSGTTYYLRAYITNDNETRYGKSIIFTTLEEGDLALCVALDNCDLVFNTGGDADWFGQSDVSYDGEHAASSGQITHNEKTWLETTVNGFAWLSFQWKVSSEYNYDFLRFFINDIEQASISGERDWQQLEYYLGAGSHTLRWVYDKDELISRGEDKGWVDQVVVVEEYLITFVVKDAITSAPVGDASIQINGHSLTTNDDGEADIRLPAGNFDYLISTMGYSDKLGSIVVTDDDIITVALGDVGTEMSSSEYLELSIYPVPAKDKLFLESNRLIRKVRLFASNGQLVYHGDVEDVTTEINVNKLFPGIYFIQVQTDEEFVVKQIIIQ